MKLFGFKEGAEEQPRKRNRGCLFSIIVFCVIYVAMSMILGASMGSMFSTPETKLKDNTVYRLEMKGQVVEQAPEVNPFEELMQELPYGAGDAEKQVGLDELVSNIRLAKMNDKIKGIYLEGGSLQIGLAAAKELREELEEFKQSGKFVVAYADNYGEMSYYVASVADKIYMSEVGMLEWHGFAAIKMYYPRLMAKLGIKMNVLKVGEFKSAVEPYICTKMSEADKKQTMQYLGGAWQEVCEGVSRSRGMSMKALNAYADELVELLPQEKYVEYGLVDSLVHGYDMPQVLRELTGTEEYKLEKTSALSAVKREEVKLDDKVAVLYAEGEITDESGEGIVAKEMLKTIRKIGKNDKVKAVVVRVNSPGGSATASEQIWYAIEQLKKKGLPVVVSMGDLAASGGYYISCGADYIYAEPTTLTGSIGIFGLVPDVSGLREKIGVDVDGVGTNKFSASHMILKGMNKDERDLMQAMVERGYDLFTRRCAEGRGKTQEEIKKIGEGRVWLGRDAVGIGLVDELGGLDEAIEKAAELAGVEHYQMAYYPEKKDFMEELLRSLENTTDEEKVLMKLKERFKEQRMMALMEDRVVW